MNIQFKKGVLELCVLSLLSRKDRYGYELATTLEATVTIAEGSVYPLLRRLKDEGFVETYLVESTEGPPRKYYRITESGRRWQEDLVMEWNIFSDAVRAVVEGDA